MLFYSHVQRICFNESYAILNHKKNLFLKSISGILKKKTEADSLSINFLCPHQNEKTQTSNQQ